MNDQQQATLLEALLRTLRVMRATQAPRGGDTAPHISAGAEVYTRKFRPGDIVGVHVLYAGTASPCCYAIGRAAQTPTSVALDNVLPGGSTVDSNGIIFPGPAQFFTLDASDDEQVEFSIFIPGPDITVTLWRAGSIEHDR